MEHLSNAVQMIKVIVNKAAIDNNTKSKKHSKVEELSQYVINLNFNLIIIT